MRNALHAALLPSIAAPLGLLDLLTLADLRARGAWLLESARVRPAVRHFLQAEARKWYVAASRHVLQARGLGNLRRALAALHAREATHA